MTPANGFSQPHPPSRSNSPEMSHLTPPTSSIQSTETIRPCAIRGESQPQRYASFSCAYQIVSQHSPQATVRILRGFTSSTTIPLLTFFISTDRLSSTETRVIRSVPLGGRDGAANDGGTNSHKFAKDGGSSYSDPHPTWVFASSVHGAHLLQTCSPTHLAFHLSSITMTKIIISLQTKRRR